MIMESQGAIIVGSSLDQVQKTPTKITVQELFSYKNQYVLPIEGINIPNITIPPHLFSKKRATEADDTITINIRHLFNSLTAENILRVQEQLRAVVYAKAHTPEILNEVAEEVLQNFIISEQNIKNYMKLLNAIWNASVLIPGSSPTEKKVSNTIGNYFLNKCRDMIFKFINEEYIRKLAEMDLDDNDQLDNYNREREKFMNLITTLCCLYDQRNTTLIKITAVHVYPVLKIIFDNYQKNQILMNKLGNPYEEDCSDENEYETLRKMCTLYAEQSYAFMSQQGKEFLKDRTPIKDQILPNLVERFKNEIIPTLTEAYLISKCENLF